MITAVTDARLRADLMDTPALRDLMRDRAEMVRFLIDLVRETDPT